MSKISYWRKAWLGSGRLNLSIRSIYTIKKEIFLIRMRLNELERDLDKEQRKKELKIVLNHKETNNG